MRRSSEEEEPVRRESEGTVLEVERRVEFGLEDEEEVGCWVWDEEGRRERMRR